MASAIPKIALIFGLVLVAQVGLGSCTDQEEDEEKCPKYCEPPNDCCQTPCDCRQSPCDCCQSPCGCCQSPCPCSSPPCWCPNAYPHQPCFRSTPNLGNNPCALTCGPACCNPIVPIIEKRYGHKLVKCVKYVPVKRKYYKPEICTRTRKVCFVCRNKDGCQDTACFPVDDKYYRNKVYECEIKIPVCYKIIRPCTYHVVRYVPASVAKCLPQCNYAPLPCPCSRCPAFSQNACRCEQQCLPCDQCAQSFPCPPPCPSGKSDEYQCQDCFPCSCKPGDEEQPQPDGGEENQPETPAYVNHLI